MTNFTFRPLAPDDVAAVAALIRAAFAAQSIATDPPPSALRVTEPDIAAHLKSGGGAVAEVGRTLVGSALWVEQDDGLYLARLAVAPAFRRCGIAKRLIAAAETTARIAGLPVLRLSTRLALRDNRRLFAAYGFAETTREAHPGYAEPTFVNMEKRLSGVPGPG
jgi:predicted N-acetyltransferase YhbS